MRKYLLLISLRKNITMKKHIIIFFITFISINYSLFAFTNLFYSDKDISYVDYTNFFFNNANNKYYIDIIDKNKLSLKIYVFEDTKVLEKERINSLHIFGTNKTGEFGVPVTFMYVNYIRKIENCPFADDVSVALYQYDFLKQYKDDMETITDLYELCKDFTVIGAYFQSAPVFDSPRILVYTDSYIYNERRQRFQKDLLKAIGKWLKMK